MWKKICCLSNLKVLTLNTITALILTFYLEYMERKSLEAVMLFVQDRTFVFLYNALILFVCLSIVFISKKKYFTYAFVSGIWFVIGTANGIILNSRKTPFTWVDITMAKSVLPVLQNYLAIWQIVGLVILLIAFVVSLVCLYLYTPDARKVFDFKANVLCLVLLCLIFAGISYVGVGQKYLIQKFDNLIAGYKDYGVAYGFCVTALDTGIDRPFDYSATTVHKVQKKMKKRIQTIEEEKEEKHQPNIIFIQLESFFDLTTVKDITCSEDPLPVIHQLQKETTSGNLRVPVYGAGTINTEFEAITGMSANHFGTGEYPYRSILQNTNCESMAYWTKALGYTASVIHNNNASFYDRSTVFTHLGFDYFISSENMMIPKRNAAGWSTDDVLIKYITSTMSTTDTPDYIYTISVQGHGDYPTDPVEDPLIDVYGENLSDSYRNQLVYYANQTHEMDAFIGNLIAQLSEYNEEVILVAYGDHLPGLDFSGDELTTGSKYKTPYFIWDNFGHNASHKKEESEDLNAYQLPAKVLAECGITEGVMNQFHQTMKEEPSYKKNMKLLEYDLLYGTGFARQGRDPLVASDLQFSINPLVINEIRKDTLNKKYLLIGYGFTEASRVYVNGIQVNASLVSPKVLSVSEGSLHEGDEIIIHQVSKTNSKTTLNHSEPFAFSPEGIGQISEGE